MQTFSLHDILYSQQLHNLYNISIDNYQIYIFSLDFSWAPSFHIQLPTVHIQPLKANPWVILLAIPPPLLSHLFLLHSLSQKMASSQSEIWFILDTHQALMLLLIIFHAFYFPTITFITTLILPCLPPHPHTQCLQHSTELSCLYPLAIWITAVISSLVFSSLSLGSERGTLYFAATVIF